MCAQDPTDVAALLDRDLRDAGQRAVVLHYARCIADDEYVRMLREAQLRLANHPQVFIIGDAATVMQNNRPLPGVAQVAIQQGRFVGRLLSTQLRSRPVSVAFRYFDCGNMAVVGKNFALLERGPVRMSGAATWLIWALIHVMFLPLLQNRLRVQIQWFWSYVTGQRGSRLIPESNFEPNLGSGHG